MRIEGNIKDLRKEGKKSEEQKETANINRLFNSRENVIQLFDDFTTATTEARYKAINIFLVINILIKRSQNVNTKQNASKIINSTWTSKAGKTSENLLNEIGQIIYYLYQGKRSY